MSHVTYEWDMSRSHTSEPESHHMQLNHVTYESVMSRMDESNITRVGRGADGVRGHDVAWEWVRNSSCSMPKCVMLHVWMRHVPHTNGSCHTYKWKSELQQIKEAAWSRYRHSGRNHKKQNVRRKQEVKLNWKMEDTWYEGLQECVTYICACTHRNAEYLWGGPLFSKKK